MKFLHIFSQVLVVVFFTITPFLPFAGKVLFVYPSTCGGEGVMIKPVSVFPSGPYGTIPGLTQSYSYDAILPQSWIIGLYNPVTIPCPYESPIFPIIAFGVSLPSFK
jgi:hypothetical protein